jgi:hypothetical protein
VTLRITSYDRSSKSRTVSKFVRPTSLTAPVRAAVPTSDRRREPDAGEDRHRSRRAGMTRNVHRIRPTSRHRGVLQRGEGRRGPHSVRARRWVRAVS